jgi:hypothetical protein
MANEGNRQLAMLENLLAFFTLSFGRDDVLKYLSLGKSAVQSLK